MGAVKPLNTIVANPATILTNPAVEMIKSIPAVWDETLVLPPSEIGELAVYARRTGKTWFLAVLNGTSERTLKVPLSFLPRGDYKASQVSDEPMQSAAVRLETRKAKRSDSLRLKLGSGGGFIARFDPQAGHTN